MKNFFYVCIVLSSVMGYFIVNLDKGKKYNDIESITKEFAENTLLLNKLSLDIVKGMSKFKIQKLLHSQKYKNDFFKEDENGNIEVGNIILIFDDNTLIRVESLNQQIVEEWVLTREKIGSEQK